MIKREYKLYQTLKILLIKNSMTNEDLADELCLTKATVDNWTRSRHYSKPSIDNIIYISNKFNVPVDWLIFGDDMGVLKGE